MTKDLNYALRTIKKAFVPNDRLTQKLSYDGYTEVTRVPVMLDGVIRLENLTIIVIVEGEVMSITPENKVEDITLTNCATIELKVPRRKLRFDLVPTTHVVFFAVNPQIIK